MSLPVLRIPADSNVLPDGPQWCNRFEVKSSSSNQTWIVSQNIVNRHWGCSCPGYKKHRKCHHLETLGLPCKEQPYEVTVQKS